MTKTLTAVSTSSIAYVYKNADTIGSPQEQTTAQNKVTYTSGGGTNQVNAMFRAAYTLTTGSPDQDVTLIGVLEDVFGESLSFNRIRSILVKNTSTTDNDDIHFGPQGIANGTGNVFGDDVDGKLTIRPGGSVLIEAPRQGYELNDDEMAIRLHYAGVSGSITVQIVIMGSTGGVVSSSSSSVIFSSSSSSSSSDSSSVAISSSSSSSESGSSSSSVAVSSSSASP